MKYPITPGYLEEAPEPVLKLFEQLEEEILADVCRRLKVSGEMTESALQQIKVLMGKGYDLSDIEEKVKKLLKMADEEYDEIMQRAIDRNKEYYGYLIEKADILPAGEIDTSVLEAIRRQTKDEFVNLTQSLGFAVNVNGVKKFLPVAEAYQRVLSNAAIKVQSGAFDYNSAIRSAVRELTDSGINTVSYASGWHNRVDVAARRAIMTGVSQLSAQYTEMANEILKTELREVSAHTGARDKGDGWKNHKVWQGKVYAMSHGHPKYKDIHEVCGLGAVDGLEGANCRHQHFLFVEGVSERAWTDEALRDIDPPPFEFEGKVYSAYDATQMQRKLETAMRSSKRRMIGAKANGDQKEYDTASARLQVLRQKYAEFSDAAGLPKQLERARIYEK